MAGLPQGSPWSPILCALFLAPLARSKRVQLYAYADDISLLSAAASKKDALGALAAFVRTLKRRLKAQGLEFDEKKSELLTFWKSRNLTSYPDLPRSGDTLLYLGCLFDWALTFAPYVRRVAQRHTKTASFVGRLRRAGDLPVAEAFCLVKACVVLGVLYAAEAW